MVDSAETITVALPVWQGRIAPLFDVARHFLLVDVRSGEITNRRELDTGTASDDPFGRVERLADAGVDVVICGGISRPVLLSLEAAGVVVHPFVAGTVEEVLDGYLSGSLQQGNLAMPGCGRGRRHRGRHMGGRGAPGPPAGPGTIPGRGFGRRRFGPFPFP